MVVTAAASASDSAWKSMSCHRVRVPPQSKITASGCTSRSWSAADEPNEMVDDLVHRHVLALAGTPVADLDRALGEVATDHEDRGHADQLCVLELHAGADLLTVVVDDLDPCGGQLGGDPVGGREHAVILAG